MQEKNKKTSVEIIADNERLTLSKLASLIGCKPQNMYDIKSGKAKSVSVSIADRILSVFPQYSRTWILTGEGDMLKEPPPKNDATAIVNNQVGNGNHFSSDMTVNQFMVELAAQRKLTEKAQEQMDRLITIIEQLNK
jgi:hypothetical protein